MKVCHICKERLEEWNTFAEKEPSFVLTQSWDWGEFKEKMGWKAFRIAVEHQSTIIAGAQMLIKSFPLGIASYAYIPRGPIGDWLNPEVSAVFFPEIHRIARSKNVVFLKIEPPLVDNHDITQILAQFNFNSVSATIQPRSTIILDIRPDLNIILEQTRKTTRRKIKDASRKGVTIRFGNHEDFPAFYKLMKTTCRRAGFPLRPYQYYWNEWKTLENHRKCIMLMAFYQDNLLAVNIIYLFGNHAAFFHQCSSNEYGNLNPNSLLVWEGIKILKERGISTYDLWGISDEIGQIISQGGELPGHERTDGLWGVYQFKSGFCKNVVFYSGAYDFIYKPTLYKINSSHFLNKNLEKLSIGFEWLRY